MTELDALRAELARKTEQITAMGEEIERMRQRRQQTVQAAVRLSEALTPLRGLQVRDNPTPEQIINDAADYLEALCKYILHWHTGEADETANR